MDAFDYIVDDSTQDLKILDGDFVVGASDQQHVEDILRAKPGQFYQWPLLGIGIENFRNASLSGQRLKQDIKLHLNSDNLRTTFLRIDPDFNIFINAERLK